MYLKHILCNFENNIAAYDMEVSSPVIVFWHQV